MTAKTAKKAQPSKQAGKTPAKQAVKQKANSNLEESYDEFPYESYVYPQTHPERMHTIATLFKIAPPDINKARVLEIGCAGGGNVIPLAILYPNTKILGIDLSKEQIAQANESKKAMGLKNIEFKQMDISKFPKSEGKFDYIICHGVFSWIPQFVRDAILEVCRNHLTPNGMAVISYNTLPGWAAVKSLREMMIFHTRSFADPAQQIKEAKQLLGFLYENVPPANEAYRQIIDRERQILSKTNDSYVFHEHLESENHQFYLHEFVDMVNGHKLGYVGDAEISTMYAGNFNENVRKTLGGIKDIVKQEQYLDFLSNRRFRQSIITHAANAATINRNLESKRITEFYVQARFKAAKPEDQPEGKTKFIVPNSESTFETVDKTTSLAFKALAAANRPVKLEELAAEIEKKEGVSAEAVMAVFLKSGFTLALQNFITLHNGPYEFATTVSEKPRASAWARHLATKKIAGGVTNLRRENIALAPFQKTLLQHLDGKNARKTLTDLMVGHVLKDELKIHKDNVKVTEEKQIREIIEQQMGPTLQRFTELALLEA